MIFLTVKCGILLMLILSAFLCVRKSKIVQKGVLLIFICFLLSLGCIVFPVENLFVTFRSPEQAYEYVYPQNTKTTVVEGQKSTLVMGG